VVAPELTEEIAGTDRQVWRRRGFRETPQQLERAGRLSLLRDHFRVADDREGVTRKRLRGSGVGLLRFAPLADLIVEIAELCPGPGQAFRIGRTGRIHRK